MIKKKLTSRKFWMAIAVASYAVYKCSDFESESYQLISLLFLFFTVYIYSYFNVREKEGAKTMSKKTGSGLISYCKKQIGKPYWYGTYGQTASESLYKSKKKSYPDEYTDSDYSTQYGQRVHDCSGLVKGYLWSDSATATPTYDKSSDRSAKTFYSKASEKGKISKMPTGKKGVLVFKGNTTSSIYHVGVYDGTKYVYQAYNHSKGVTKSVFNSSDWDYYAVCDLLDYSDSATTTSDDVTASEQAQEYKKSLAGTYTVIRDNGAYMRDGAGLDKTKIVKLAKKTKVKNYGYYSESSNGVKWLYCTATVDNITYTGFIRKKVLEKED